MLKAVVPSILAAVFLLPAVKSSAQAQASRDVLQNPAVAAAVADLSAVGDLEQINDDLRALAPYVRVVTSKGAEIQLLDSDAALANAAPPAVVALAVDIMTYQNALLRSLRSPATATPDRAMRPSLTALPRVKALMTIATHHAKHSAPSMAAVANTEPCGDVVHPVPNYRPPDQLYSTQTPVPSLLLWGFHETVPYACRQVLSCPNDYTRWRSYTGPYGNCEWPRFRDHGHVAGSTGITVQSGEPNPEIHAYLWPYWYWGVYVYWWHDLY